jgi:hypothetical protein
VQFRTNPDGSITEIPPERCPNGHELKYPNVIMDGSGYPTVRRPDGTTVQTAPTHCPNGQRLGPRRVIASWSPRRGMSGWLCLTCGMKVWRDGSTTQEAVPRLD